MITSVAILHSITGTILRNGWRDFDGFAIRLSHAVAKELPHDQEKFRMQVERTKGKFFVGNRPLSKSTFVDATWPQIEAMIRMDRAGV
jgi:hypothetical protein